MVDEPLFDNRFIAWVAVKGDDGNPPGSLAGNTPVRTISDHVGDPLFTPFRQPANPLDRFQGLLAQFSMIQLNKPLRCRSKDYRIVTAPAVRIRMADRLCS